MRKLVADILLFTLLAGLVWITLSGVSALFIPEAYTENIAYEVSGSNGHSLTRLQEAEQTKKVDVLVIGSSHAYRGFDPRIFKQYGITLFNLGSSSQTPVQSHYLLKQYLLQIKPKLVIIEAFPRGMTNNGLGSALDLVPKTPFVLDKLEMALTINQVQLYNTLAANAFDIFFRVTDYQNLTEPASTQNDVYIPGGFVSTARPAYDGELERNEIYGGIHYQFEKLEQSVSLIKEQGLPVILVEAPTSQVWMKQVVPSKASRKRLMRLDTDGYWIWNEIITSPYPDSLFYDPHHLRQSGVKRFNRELLPLLLERFPFIKEGA
jgi:hypothetical protein